MKSFTTVNYHYVRPIKGSRYPTLKGLEIKKFINQINFLIKNYNIISGDDLINSIIHKIKLPNKDFWPSIKNITYHNQEIFLKFKET